MKKVDSQWNPLSFKIFYSKVKFFGSIQFFIQVFGGQRNHFIRGPIQIGASEVFIPIGLLADKGPRENRLNEVGDFLIPVDEFRSSVKVCEELLIHGTTIRPRIGGIRIVIELVETGHLGRFEGLVGYQCPFERPEDGTAKGRSRQRIPADTDFGVELILLQIEIIVIFCIGIVKVPAGPEGEGDIVQDIDVRIKIDIWGEKGLHPHYR